MPALFKAAAILFFTATPAIAQSNPPATVPVVGCPADGQLGPVAAPSGKSKRVLLPAAIAAQLAWYSTAADADQLGVLGPRGWQCFGAYGSNGASLYVAPEPLDANKLLLHKEWHGFSGPAIELSVSNGGTSGRFEVARVIARVFPAHQPFARNVIAENLDQASDFPFGPYPADHLTYKSKELVEFTTPPHAKGLGTASWLLPNDSAIVGMASLDPTGDVGLVQLALRLPKNAQTLAQSIIHAEEEENSQPK